MEILNRLKTLWLEKAQAGEDHKEREFGRVAKECMKFYDGPHDFMYSPAVYLTPGLGEAQNVAEPWKRMTVNKCAEMVQVFLPYLYHKNPTRSVEPRVVEFPPEIILGLLPPEYIQQATAQAAINGMPFDPASLIPRNPTDPLRRGKAELLNWVLNYTPNELDLKTESRRALVEGLVKGRGLAWTEVFQGPTGRMVGSFYESVDNLVLDPDAQRLRDCAWAMRRRRLPVYRVERMFPNIPKGKIKSNREMTISPSIQSTNPAERDSTSHEEIIVYEIYSRCGAGQNLVGAAGDMKEALAGLGDFVYLAVTDDYEFPLNLTPDMFDEENPDSKEVVSQSVSWPTPWHRDKMHPWPFSEIDFHYRPEKIWPMAHLKPALGEQRFLNWAYTWLAKKMRTTTRDLWLADQTVGDDFIEALATGGDDMVAILKKTAGKTWDELVHVLQAPDPPQSLAQVIEMMERNFEMRTGVNELMSRGDTDTQMRSASEANVRREMTQVRPEDMANLVEDWQTNIARKEAVGLQFHLRAPDVASIFGESYNPQVTPGQLPQVGFYTQAWDDHVASSNIDEIISEFDYRIESSSMRKPNVAQEISSIDESAQVVLPILSQSVGMTGDWSPVNAWLRQFARTRNLPEGTFQITPPPMPMMPPGQAPQGGQPPPNGQPQGQQPPPNGQPQQGPPQGPPQGQPQPVR